MIKYDEEEEIVGLIYKGFDLELLSLELNIPKEQLQSYKKKSDLRKSVQESLNSHDFQTAFDKLNSFVQSYENNIVERYILIKLKSYVNNIPMSQDELNSIIDSKSIMGFSKDIDQILENFKIRLPKRKSSNIKKKDKQPFNISENSFSDANPLVPEEPVFKRDYSQTIQEYKKEISANPNKSLNTRNLLAFAYLKSGMLDDARSELLSLIKEYSSYNAYRQLIYLENINGNYEDAKLWAYEALDKFPDNISIRNQLISIAKKENDHEEIINQLKEIININPTNKNKIRLEQNLQDDCR